MLRLSLLCLASFSLAQTAPLGCPLLDVQTDPPLADDTGAGSRLPTTAANAGADQEVEPGAAVTLDGSASLGDELTYAWSQLEDENAAMVTLAETGTVQTSLEAPPFDSAGGNGLVFELLVRDMHGRVSRDRVTITVLRPEGSSTAGDNLPEVRMVTSMGIFVVELYPDQAPITVENFLQYVDDGFYDGTIFHRVVRDFVVQGGGLLPGMIEKNTRDPITNEADNGLLNERRTLSMARTADPESGTSQFFINVSDNTNLDASSTFPGHAVFGRVITGMDVVDRINRVATGAVALRFQDVPDEDVVLWSAERVPDTGTTPLVPGDPDTKIAPDPDAKFAPDPDDR